MEPMSHGPDDGCAFCRAANESLSEPLVVIDRRGVIHAANRAWCETGTHERFLAALLSTSMDAVIAQRPDGTVMSWNGAAEDMLGYTAAEMIGRRPWNIVPAPRRDEQDAMREAAKSGVAISRLQTEWVGKGGVKIPLTLSATPVPAPDGTIEQIVMVIRNATEEVQLQSRLEQIEQLAELGRTAVALAREVDLALNVIHINPVPSSGEVPKSQEIAHSLATACRRVKRLADEILRKSPQHDDSPQTVVGT